MKRSISFTDGNNNFVTLDIEIREKNEKKQFAISGKMGHSSGQCKDSIKPKNEAQKSLLKIWDQWHLNDMNPGTKNQRKVLENCPEKDYQKRVEYLESHKRDGTPLSKIEYDRRARSIVLTKERIESLKLELSNIDLFLTEYKKGNIRSWVKITNTPFIDKMRKSINHSDLKEHHVWKNGNNLYGRISNPLNAIKNEAHNELNEAQKSLDSYRLESALYDFHPKTGEIYQYGCGWITDDLPNDLGEQIEDICTQIETIEQEEKEASPLFKDPLYLDADDHEEGSLLFDIEHSGKDPNCGALAIHLGLNFDEYTEIEEGHGYGNCSYEAQGTTYYCGTREEMTETVKEYIEQSVWAFNASFLKSQTGLPEEAFRGMQDKCEGANDDILSMINKTCGIDSFVDAAINADGYGQFLNSYDGTESEVSYNDETYIICEQ